MKRLVVFIAAAVLLAAQPASSSKEQSDLDRALAQAGGSPVEYLRAIEQHLRDYPNSPRRAELERAAARAAIEAGDNRALILYGQRALERQTGDAALIEAVTRALLAGDSTENSRAALKYAERLEQLIRAAPHHEGDHPQRELGDALRYEARATGNLGRARDALALAQRSFQTFPDADAAREIARWYERLDGPEKAAEALADAFTIPDPRNTDAARAHDRALMGALWRQVHGSEAGLGDLILHAYDRNAALVNPKAQPASPMDLTLTALAGDPLKMSSLKGQIVVLDFWATWCIPCREQHPFYEDVQRSFAADSRVVFLSIDTDDDRTLVTPFVHEQHWSGKVYFDSGLSEVLDVVSIPTTIVLDRSGAVYSRIEGFDRESFARTLTSRIRAAIGF